jgi:hypothetical protein
MMSSYDQIQKADEAKEKLTKAFGLLQKRGLIARQSFSCCGGCASYELATRVAAAVTKDARQKEKIRGVCFYSRQGGFFEKGRRGYVRVRSCFLQFGQVDTKEHGPVGLPTVDVGKLVCECLTEAGLTWKWNGDENETIEVLPGFEANRTRTRVRMNG